MHGCLSFYFNKLGGPSGLKLTINALVLDLPSVRRSRLAGIRCVPRVISSKKSIDGVVPTNFNLLPRVFDSRSAIALNGQLLRLIADLCFQEDTQVSVTLRRTFERYPRRPRKSSTHFLPRRLPPPPHIRAKCVDKQYSKEC